MWNYIQYHVITYNGKKSKSLCVSKTVYLNLTQYCKSTLLQFKKKEESAGLSVVKSLTLVCDELSRLRQCVLSVIRSPLKAVTLLALALSLCSCFLNCPDLHCLWDQAVLLRPVAPAVLLSIFRSPACSCKGQAPGGVRDGEARVRTSDAEPCPVLAPEGLWVALMPMPGHHKDLVPGLTLF